MAHPLFIQICIMYTIYINIYTIYVYTICRRKYSHLERKNWYKNVPKYNALPPITTFSLRVIPPRFNIQYTYYTY